MLAQRTEASSVSPLTEAQLHFPGYQEFFFIFLHSANNYNFGTHLRAAFVATMINLSSDQSTNSLEKRLMNLQLFARFLGFLIFSPNWHGAEIDSAKIRPIVLADGLYQLESLGLSPMKMVEDAWVGGYTVSVVPWVTELLKMAKWDSLSQTSLTFRQLLANLRNIQSFVSSKDAIEVDRFGPSMQILSLCLETFFYEANGLAKLTSLPQASLSSVATVAADSLDRLSIGFSTAAFFASSPHIEDLSNLINGLCVSTVGKSPNKWRKLRPSVVSHGINLEASNLFPESPNKIGIPPPSDEWKSPKSVGWNGAFGSQTRNIQTKLVHAFFHQHRDVKEVCEFSVSQVLKNVSNQALSACIKPAFEEQKLRGDSSDHDFENAQEVALHSSQAFLKSLMETSLRKSLEVLGPPGLHPKVLDIAIFLSVTRGVHSGQALLHTLVLNESKTLRKSLEREKKKESQGKEVTFIEEQPASPRDKALQDLLSAVDALEHYLCSSSNKAANDVALLASEADKLLKSFFTVLGCAMPTELSLRRLFESVFRLDCTSASFIEWCLGLGDQDCYSVLMPYLWFSIELSRLTLHGLKTLSECLQEEVLVQLLSKFCRCPAVSLDEIACLVMGMLESGIIEISHVRYLNSACVNDQVREIAGLVESGRRGK